MTYKLFLDDLRDPVTNDWIIARDYKQAVRIVMMRGIPSELALDHDLGDGPTGYDFVKWLVDYDFGVHQITADFNFSIHSQNPVGAENMRRYLTNYLKTLDI